MIDLNAFYSENKWLLLCLAIAIVMVVFYAFFRYVYAHPKWVDDGDDDRWNGNGLPTLKNPPPPPARRQLDTQVYDSDVITDMTHEAWQLRAKILNCNSLSMMGELYWKVEEFEDWYRDRVPDGVLIQQVNGLYNIHTIVAKSIADKKASLSETGS